MDKQRAVRYLEELVEQIHLADIRFGECRICVFLTFGVADCKDSTNVETLLKCADQNLYRGKEQGKNRIL